MMSSSIPKPKESPGPSDLPVRPKADDLQTPGRAKYRIEWLWACHNCGKHAGMTTFVDQCPGCQHGRCWECQLESVKIRVAHPVSFGGPVSYGGGGGGGDSLDNPMPSWLRPIPRPGLSRPKSTTSSSNM